MLHVHFQTGRGLPLRGNLACRIAHCPEQCSGDHDWTIFPFRVEVGRTYPADLFAKIPACAAGTAATVIAAKNIRFRMAVVIILIPLLIKY